MAEISPAIVEAARRYFQVGNQLDRRPARQHAPRRRPNFLLVTDAKYDLIAWSSPASGLPAPPTCTAENFTGSCASVSRQAVSPTVGPTAPRVPADFATVVGTLHAEFRHVALFYGGGQGILVASDRPLRASQARLTAFEADPRIAFVLPDHRPLSALTADILALDDGLDAFLQASAQKAGLPREALVSTDESLYLEYATRGATCCPGKLAKRWYATCATATPPQSTAYSCRERALLGRKRLNLANFCESAPANCRVGGGSDELASAEGGGACRPHDRLERRTVKLVGVLGATSASCRCVARCQSVSSGSMSTIDVAAVRACGECGMKASTLEDRVAE